MKPESLKVVCNKKGGGVGKVHGICWALVPDHGIDVLLWFHFAVVFSLMYVRFRQVMQKLLGDVVSIAYQWKAD
jgi:hypothetical protein